MKKLILILPLVAIIFSGCSFLKTSYYDSELHEAVNSLHKEWGAEAANLYDEEKAASDPSYKKDYELGVATMEDLKKSIDHIFEAQKKKDEK